LHRAGALMVTAMDDVPPTLRGGRVALAVRSVVSMLGDREQQIAADGMGPTPPAVFVAQLVDLLHAMVTAPPSPTLAAELRAAALLD
jgi:hypothetical protein